MGPLGIAVLRAWLETGTEPRLRVRITETTDPVDDQPTATVVASADEACVAIRRWLDRLLEIESGATDEPGPP